MFRRLYLLVACALYPACKSVELPPGLECSGPNDHGSCAVDHACINFRCAAPCDASTECDGNFVCDNSIDNHNGTFSGFCSLPSGSGSLVDTIIKDPPPGATRLSTITFHFEALGAVGTKIFQCKLNNEDFALCPGSTVGSVTYSGIGTGKNTFQVRVIDGRRVQDETPALFEWWVDLTPPDAWWSNSATKPSVLPVVPSGAFGPAKPLNITVNGTDTGGPSATPRFECQIPKGLNWQSCPGSTVDLSTVLADGAYTISVRAVDEAGNEKLFPDLVVTIDRIAPDIIFDATPLSETASTHADFKFHCTSGDCTFACKVDVDPPVVVVPPAAEVPFTACASSYEVEKGAHKFQVRATEPSGNVSTKEFTWTIVSPWTEVSIGAGHACALDAESDLYCWGSTANGRLGVGATSALVLGPTKVLPAGSKWTSVAAGRDFTCAMRRDENTLYCWGNLASAGLSGTSNEPVLQSGSGKKFDATFESSVGVAAASEAASVSEVVLVAKRSSSSPFQLFSSSYSSPLAPSSVFSSENGAARFGVSQFHMCLQKSDGQVLCRGDSGLTGHSGTTTSNVRTVNDALVVATRLSVGTQHACAIDTADASMLQCWGNSNQYQVACTNNPNNTCGKRLLTTAVVTGAPVGTTWIDVAAGGEHTCAIAASNTKRDLYCWGSNSNLQLGYVPSGDARVQTTGPGKVLVDVGDPVSVFAAGNVTCWMTSDGDLWCMGDGANGRLGNIVPSTGNFRYGPVHVRHAASVDCAEGLIAGASGCSKP